MCPIIQETAIALNDRAARRLGQGRGAGRRAGYRQVQAPRVGYQAARNGRAGYQEAGYQESLHPSAEARSSDWVPVAPGSPAPWRGEEPSWQEARAGQDLGSVHHQHHHQHRPRRPNLLQRLLLPINRAAARLR